MITDVSIDPANSAYIQVDDVIYFHTYSLLVYYPVYKTDTTYTVHADTTTILNYAMYDNEYLTTLSLPYSLLTDSIYMNFRGLSNLTTFTTYATSHTQRIDDLEGMIYSSDFTVLYSCPPAVDYHNYALPNSVISVNHSAFENVQTIEVLTMNEGLQSTGYYAFKNMDNLLVYNFASTQTIMNPEMFYDSDALTSLNVPGSIDLIAMEAFAEMDSLVSLTLNEGTGGIASDILYNTPGVTTINIPSTITSMGGTLFRGASGMVDVTIHPANTSYIEYEQGVILTYDQQYLMVYLEGLTASTYTLPSVITFNWADFGANPHLEYIYIPGNVTYIYGSFTDLPNLKEIHLERVTPDPTVLSSHRLPRGYDYDIYIYDTVLDDYLSTGLWSDYLDWISSKPYLP